MFLPVLLAAVMPVLYVLRHTSLREFAVGCAIETSRLRLSITDIPGGALPLYT